MPKVEKIRITGVRYDKMRKQYENTVFDLTNEAEPQHALLTLVNGGGKGLLLQMLFQVVLPLTTWGKNGENHVDALFYNEKQQFNPYTFHVALEWRLDTDQEEWLVTGICVTAEVKQAQGEEDFDTEPQYFLYTGRYRKPADWTLGTLPLYDEDSKAAVGFEEWQTWLKKHKQDFDIYTKSKQQAYYQYLSTYGIERTEWRHMKEINRDEGGIEHYFKKGLDNFGLFHHIIIPEISSYLQDDQGEDLASIFRDSAVIAQKLPELLKREKSYETIQGVLQPMKTILEEGQAVQKSDLEHQEHANLIYSGMESQRQSYLHEQNKWIEEKDKTAKEQTEVLWQQANLEYAEKYRSRLEMVAKLMLAEEKVKAVEAQLKQYKDEAGQLRIDLLLADHAKLSAELEQIENHIRRLENAEQYQDEQEQQRRLESEVRIQWVSIQSELKRDTEHYHALMAQFGEDIQALHQQSTQAKKQQLEIRSKLGTFRDQIKQHNEQAVRMQQKFGELINRDPEAVYKKQRKSLEEWKGRIASRELEVEELRQREAQLHTELGEGEAEIRRLVREAEAKAEARRMRLETEEKLHQAWCRFRQEDSAFIPYTEDVWNELGRQVETAISRLRSDVEGLKKDYWKLQLDSALLHEECWIPNDDVRKLKQLLGEVGIPSVYGTELIHELEEKEQQRLKEQAALLPYGLVVYQQDWEQRFDPDAFADLFARAPVPVFIREKMKEPCSYPYALVVEQGIEMAFQKERWFEWKEKVTQNTVDIAASIEQVQERLQEVEALASRVQALREKTYEAYAQEEESVKAQLVEQRKNRHERRDALSEIAGQITDGTNWLKEQANTLKGLEQDCVEIKRWIEEHQRFIQIQNQRNELQVRSNKVDAVLQELEQKAAHLTNEQNQWKESFLRWKLSCEATCEQLREIVHDARFPDKATFSRVEMAQPHLRSTLFQELSSLVKQWQLLRQKMNNMNSELTEWRTKQSYCSREYRQVVTKLERQDTAWKDRTVPTLPVEIMQAKLEQTERTINVLNEELRTTEGDFKKLQGKLEEISNAVLLVEHQILEQYRRPAETWADLNLTDKRNEIVTALNQLQKDLDAQQNLIAKLGDLQQRLLSQKDILKTHIHVIRELGEVPDAWKEQIRSQPDKLIGDWIARKKQIEIRKASFHSQYKGKLRELSAAVQQERIDAMLRNQMNQLIVQLESDSVRSGLDIVSSVIEHIQFELKRLKHDMQTAEEAKAMWVDRAVYRVYSILQELKRMVIRMKIKNKEGHPFPLVDIDRMNEIVNANEEEYQRLLREYFIQTIEKLLEANQPIDQLTDKEVKQYISDSQLVLAALRNRYPTLFIYKPQTTNAFLYEKPRKHHYTTWETLNKGSKIEAKGSGGQLLAARTIIMMMVMTFKRQEQSTNWTVFVTDNPFGQAVSAHVLDPIFAIAEILRFQWIVLAPPELIKLDVSRRFPVYWKLDLQKQKHHETVTEVLQHGGRKYDDVTDLFDLNF